MEEIKTNIDPDKTEIKIDTKSISQETDLKILKDVKKHSANAPTYNPTTFQEQFYFFDDGVNKKLYININNTWVSVTLT